MFGLERKSTDDDLPVFVHAVTNDEIFQTAVRLWQENARLMYIDKTNHKEFVRFTYAKPACSVWLQRDEGREGVFELVLHWKETDTTEVFVLSSGTGAQAIVGSERLDALLQAMLTVPSVVPAVKRT